MKEAFSNSYRYAGYYQDSESNLYYLQSRYYNARTARFLSEDTASGKYTDSLSLNRHTCCHNQPVGNFANQLISKGTLRKVDPTQVFTSADANVMGGLGAKLGDGLLKTGGKIAGKFLETAGKEAAAKAAGSVVQKGLEDC